MMNMEQLLLTGEDVLSRSGIQDAKLDAWYLMEYYFHLDRVSFWINRGKKVDSREKKEYFSLIEKRKRHIPLQYITNRQEFMGISFYVNEDVLIPRQDTECLVEKVLSYCKEKTVLDMCTGSGCIIISLARLSRLAAAVGADISKKALIVAEKNAAENDTAVTFVQSNLFSAIEAKYDIIVANPPYIESKVIEGLMPEVRDYEPLLALDGKKDGLYFYRKIIAKARDHLWEGGRIFFEIGYNQAKSVKIMLQENGFQEIEVCKDLCGLDRIICATCI